VSTALLIGPDGRFIAGSNFLMDGGVTAAYWYGASWRSFAFLMGIHSMMRRMALPTFQILVTVSLIIAASSVSAQSGGQLPGGGSDPGLSAECFVPDAQLFALAPLKVVKAALDEKHPVKVLVLGSSAMSALGTGSASYPAWLERELERLLPGSDFVMEHRTISG